MRSRTAVYIGSVRIAWLLGLVLVAAPAPLGAQYFGRNKVQYEDFDFRVMNTEHFSIHFYPEELQATRDAARMAERWYTRLSGVFDHKFANRPLIFYADHPDFQQTNVISGFLGQGTGGVTEALRNRVVMPFTGSYRDNDHVLGHELVHVFQYSLAQSPGGGGLAGMSRLPLWLIEGMAEYLSLGREDPHTAMWLRDAALRGELPTIEQLTRDPRFFPYRYGQALWAYIGGRWGDGMVIRLYKEALREGWDPAVRKILGINGDELSKEWITATRAAYLPAMQGRARARDVAKLTLAKEIDAGDMNLSPMISPDGRHVVFFSELDLFSIDLFLADARTGEVLKKLTSSGSDPHFEALSFISSAGSWSPDARKFAFVVFAKGNNELAILDVASRDVERRISVRGVGAISSVAWSPDGRSIAFAGSAGGLSDIYLLDVGSGTVRQLTQDRYADLQPAWSPDGRTLAFVTDRGPETDFGNLTYGEMRIALLDVGSSTVRELPLFAGAKHINPQYSPDGRDLFFIADRGGFSDIYRIELSSGRIFQVTNLATGASGVTALSPAMSVALHSGRMLFSVFENAEYNVYALEPEQTRGQPAGPAPERLASAGILPPAVSERTSVVAEYLALPTTGLPADGAATVKDYSPSLRLDYLGQPTIGVGMDRFGTAIGGGISAFFSDMLGDHMLGTAIQASGTLKDIGGQAFYQNRERRWNWAVGAAHIPYLTGFTTVRPTTVVLDGRQFRGQRISQTRQRVFIDEAVFQGHYPFSMTRRAEFNAGYTHYGYDFEQQSVTTIGSEIVADSTRELPAPEGVHSARVAAAYVGDYSFFGFTSPVAGGRYRFEVAPVFGTVQFQTALADYRRYFFKRPVTLALRGLHYGRYGKDADSERLVPLFLGYETFVRGYAIESFDVADECNSDGVGIRDCPAFDRLVGSKLGVFNLELRAPLFGVEDFGLITLPFLSTEIALFFDGGVAWTGSDRPDFRFERETTARVPVFSTGVSARMNILGYLILEAYYAYPFQRPEKGAHFGFQLAPGW